MGIGFEGNGGVKSKETKVLIECFGVPPQCNNYNWCIMCIFITQPPNKKYN